ncbi:bacitracin synthase 3-like [Coccinella septempunctata]|uniref:bacitracin synthase 3-like n=1 Tax=Coccinella septempunctata TaxID=41139 RepID=UPI001D086956|nr:bacitracin synthase 3-like [Coccinella septempunctata]
MDANIIKGEEIERKIFVNLGELTYQALQLYADNIIQIDADTGEKLRASSILQQAKSIAKFLVENDVHHGDAVAIISENRLEFCVVTVAVFFVGATLAPFNPEYTSGELNHVMGFSKPKLVFASNKAIPSLTSCVENHPCVRSIITFEKQREVGVFGSYTDILTGTILGNQDIFSITPYDPERTIATILCSSGTSGTPKGVKITHYNITSCIEILSKVINVMKIDPNEDETDSMIGIAPFFHSFGFLTMFLHLLRGKTMVVFKKFSLKLFLDSILKYRIRSLMVPPPLLVAMLKDEIVEKYDLSFVKEIYIGAAPVGKEIESQLSKRFNIRHAGQSYGMTETTWAVISSPHGNAKVGSVGKVFPGMMAKIINENGQSLGPYEKGELCLKGPMIMDGYADDEVSTRNCIDEDKWLHTGDVAYYDEDEYFFIVDRLKELIKYKGFQVSPTELENLLLSHPSIIDAAVAGLPDDYAGEIPIAFVVKRPGHILSAEDVQKFVSDNVSPQKYLRGGVVFIREIPRNANGKVSRKILKQNIRKLKLIHKLKRIICTYLYLSTIMEKNIIRGEEIERSIESNLGELTYILLQSYEENVLQIDAVSGEELKGALLLRRAIRVANYFRTHGIGLGDSVSVMSENRLEFVVIPVAAFLVGASFAPLNPEYTPGELKHVLNLSKPKMIFSSELTISKLIEIRKDHPYIEQLVLFGSDQIDSSYLGFDRIVKGAEEDEINFEVEGYSPEDTVATILCSSGTTGMPKGVMCTHYNMTSFLEIARAIFSRMLDDHVDGQSNVVGIIPFFHSFGFMTMYLNILRGSTMIVFNKFKPKIFLDAIVKYKISRLLVPPPILLFLVKHPLAQKYDLSFLKEILAGAAPLSKETEMELKKKFKVRHVGQGYGMTETTLGVMTNPFDKSKSGSVGVVVPGMMAKVIDEQGNALGPHQEGELCLKGPLIMKGYIGDEEATNNCIDKDKWLHTGDVAYYDEEKYFFIVDRIKELIKYKAYQVPPAELEALLLTHPAVSDAAVIGLPDENAGELPFAFVVTKENESVSAEELKEFVASKVSPQKKLRGGVRFVKEIPRNPSGKILRRVLKQQAIAYKKSKL